MGPKIKRRKLDVPDEITFDISAREDYLTGFHKRKLQRIKHAKEEGAKKERELKLDTRKRMREQRKKDLQDHVEQVNAMIKKAETLATDEEDEQEHQAEDQKPSESGDDASTDEDATATDDHEDEFVDEGKYTTVTVQPMNLSDADFNENMGVTEKKQSLEDEEDDGTTKKRIWTKEKPASSKPKKKKKPKFRYESKVERKATRLQQKVKKKKRMAARESAS